HREAQAMRLAGAVVRILAEDHHLHLLEGRGVQGGEDLRPGRMDALAGRLFPTQEGGQFLHLRPLQVFADPGLPGGFQADAVLPGPRQRLAILARSIRPTRSWNSSLVTSRRSSIGFCTRSLAPARSRSLWLAGLASPVITSTGSMPLT